ncbi:ion channel [Microbacterium sp. NPDC087868]|uniref:ion channel n=1 Tax=Microbacterium sp. NPDC087868 TaxID=3364195 RepID=UPI00384FD8A3
MTTTRRSSSAARARRSRWDIGQIDGVAGYALVIVLLVASYALSAAQRTPDPSPLAFLIILVTVAVVFRITDVRTAVQRASWVILAVSAAVTIAASLLGAKGHVLDIVLSAATLLALLVSPTAIIGHQVKRRGLNLEALLATIAAYVLVGLFFAFAFNLLALVSQAPLFGDTGEDSLANQLFFSFTTLTTTGYGNLVPVGANGQAIAVTEAITGQLFLITAVARIMRGASGMRTAGQSTPTPTKETP